MNLCFKHFENFEFEQKVSLEKTFLKFSEVMDLNGKFLLKWLGGGGGGGGGGEGRGDI